MLLRDLVIIGAGTAGLNAAVKATQAGLKPVLFERDIMFGGQIGGIVTGQDLETRAPGVFAIGAARHGFAGDIASAAAEAAAVIGRIAAMA
jgi:thioredoxin reductase